MNATELYEKYEEIKENLQKGKGLRPEQESSYLLGWVDCALYILKELEND